MYISIDIGGTNTRIAHSTNLKDFDDIQRFPTPKSCTNIKGKVHNILDSYKDIKAISLGVAGLINHNENRIIQSPHIPCINNKHLSDLIGDIPSAIKTYMNNDAALAGLGEATIGLGKDYDRVAYITVSTGVGGTLVVNRTLPDTQYNFEPGHHVMCIDGEPLALKKIKGSWESFSSGTGFEQRYGVSPEDYNDPKIWQEYGENLGVGLLNISLLWRPQVIVLGGSISKKSHLFLNHAEEKLVEYIPDTKPIIKISNLGDSNGLIGGLILIKNKQEEFLTSEVSS